MLKMVGIDKSFNIGTINEKQIFKGLNLTINDGDFITVIGGNGAGKSTMLNLIAGVHKADGGRIFLDNEDLTYKNETQRAKYIGRVFQDPMMGTAPSMMIEETLRWHTEEPNAELLLGEFPKRNAKCTETL